VGKGGFFPLIHVCTKRDGRWRDLPGNTIIATHYPKPEGLGRERWAQNISYMWYVDANEMVRAIVGGLTSPDGPRYVMIDELKAETADMISHAAYILRTEHPELAGRWGVYLVNGSNVSYGRGTMGWAVDQCLIANAIICPEFYLQASKHQTDRKIKKAMMGSLLHKRASWLIKRRKHLRSVSRVVALMGVTPKYLDEPTPELFATRQSRIWQETTGATMGAWKWDLGTEASPKWNMWKGRR
jgi:hypothetical protein